MMRFCEKDGMLLTVEKGKKSLVCRKCGRHYTTKGEKLKISESMHDTKKNVVVMGKDEGVAELPVTKIMCPECENMEAYWWMQQTRSADEPPTLFYKCKKCGYSWRSYG
ncbi:transcription factor S [archaeon]|nr:MAG: transcription factor S [archaeon]